MSDEPGEGQARGEAATVAGEGRPRRRWRRATRPGTGTGASGTAADDGDVGWGDAAAGGRDVPEDRHERWLHEQRPPHWD